MHQIVVSLTYMAKPYKPKYKLVFEKDGSLVRQVNGSFTTDPDLPKKLEASGLVIEEPGYEIMAYLHLTHGWSSYGGSTYLRWEDANTGATFYQTFDDFYNTIKHATLRKGSVNGKWGFVKKGRVQSIVLIEEIQTD